VLVAAGNLLVESLTDDRLLLRWSHRSVALVASRRYRREIDSIKAAHHDIASLFLETWLHGKPSPHAPPRSSMSSVPGAAAATAVDPSTPGFGVIRRHESLFVTTPLACDRHVAPQPLLFSDTAYNLRRLSELWYQLLNAGNFLSSI